MSQLIKKTSHSAPYNVKRTYRTISYETKYTYGRRSADIAAVARSSTALAYEFRARHVAADPHHAAERRSRTNGCELQTITPSKKIYSWRAVGPISASKKCGRLNQAAHGGVCESRLSPDTSPRHLPHSPPQTTKNVLYNIYTTCFFQEINNATNTDPLSTQATQH